MDNNFEVEKIAANLSDLIGENNEIVEALVLRKMALDLILKWSKDRLDYIRNNDGYRKKIINYWANYETIINETNDKDENSLIKFAISIGSMHDAEGKWASMLLNAFNSKKSHDVISFSKKIINLFNRK